MRLTGPETTVPGTVAKDKTDVMERKVVVELVGMKLL